MRLENYYTEQAPTSETGAAWIPRPGAVRIRELTGPIRGLYREPDVLSGDVVAVFGSSVLRISEGGSVTDLGIVTDGASRVIIAGSLAGVMVADGVSLQYSTGSTLSTIATPFEAPIWVGYLAGFWLCIPANSQRRYWTQDTAPTNWGGLDFDTAAERPDNLVGAAIAGGRIWDMGQRSVEFRYPSGVGEAPFVAEVGRAYDRGCLARDSVVPIDNTVFWVGEDRIVYRGGDTPQAVSDEWFSELIARASDIFAFTMSWDGHVFYGLSLHGVGTYLFDIRVGAWVRWSTYGQTMLAQSFVVVGWDDKPLLASNDGLYTLSADAFKDGDLPVVGLVTGGVPIRGERPVSYSLNLEVSTGGGPVTGEGSAPIVQMRTSRDGGFTWGAWRSGGLGLSGDYAKRVRWTRMGQYKGPGALFEFRVSDPVPRRISGAYLDGGF